MIKITIPDKLANQWVENFPSNLLRYEIDSEIIQSISGKPLPEIDDTLHHLSSDMREWLDNTGKRYNIVVAELNLQRQRFYIEFEDQDVATQFSVTWL